jgi:DNA-directed RNA polymerase specialized sigma24 family protein
MTQSEAAGVLDVSAKTVQRRLNRCLLLLADQLGDLNPVRATSAPADPGGSQRNETSI